MAIFARKTGVSGAENPGTILGEDTRYDTSGIDRNKSGFTQIGDGRCGGI